MDMENAKKDAQLVVPKDQGNYIHGLIIQTLPRRYLRSPRVSFNGEDLLTAACMEPLGISMDSPTRKVIAEIIVEFKAASAKGFISMEDLMVRVQGTCNCITYQSPPARSGGSSSQCVHEQEPR